MSEERDFSDDVAMVEDYIELNPNWIDGIKKFVKQNKIKGIRKVLEEIYPYGYTKTGRRREKPLDSEPEAEVVGDEG